MNYLIIRNSADYHYLNSSICFSKIAERRPWRGNPDCRRTNSNPGCGRTISTLPLQSLSRLQHLGGVGGLPIDHQPADLDPFIGAGRPDLPALGPANRPRRRVASPPSEGGLYEGDFLISHSRTRVSPRRRKRGVIGRPHEVENLARRTSPGQPAVFRGSLAEVLPAVEILLD